jgi:hypothetical protein
MASSEVSDGLTNDSGQLMDAASVRPQLPFSGLAVRVGSLSRVQVDVVPPIGMQHVVAQGALRAEARVARDPTRCRVRGGMHDEQPVKVDRVECPAGDGPNRANRTYSSGAQD